MKVIAWRQAHKASIQRTAKHWFVSEASVKRWSKDFGAAAEAERERYQQERLDSELAQHSYGYRMMYLGQRNRHLSWVASEWEGRCTRAKGTAQEGALEAARETAMLAAEAQFAADWRFHMGAVPE